MQSNARILVVEDNAAIHNACHTIAARSSLGLNRLEHPPSSPDLNPIEAMWKEVKYQVARMPRASNLEQLKQQILVAWNNIPIDFVNRLILGMPARRLAVLKAKGLHTPY